jgi:hypothetical protein
VGLSGYSRKTTAMKFIRRLIRDTNNCNVLNSLSSYEGLLQRMTQPEDSNDLTIYRYVICILSELNSLLRKSRNEGVSNIIPGLLELYDTPDEVNNNTKREPIKVKDPFFGILSAIQPGVLAKEMQKGDIDSGFTGRFLYITGTVKEPVAIPEKINQENWNDIVNKIIEIKNSLPFNESKEISLSKDCNGMWTTFYNEHREHCKQSSELIATLIERIPENVRKLATIFAVCNGHTEIKDSVLEDSISIGNWCMLNTERLFSDFGKQLHEIAEDKILGVLKRNNGIMSRRSLQNSCHYNTDSETLERALYNLEKSEQVIISTEGKKKIVKLVKD